MGGYIFLNHNDTNVSIHESSAFNSWSGARIHVRRTIHAETRLLPSRHSLATSLNDGGLVFLPLGGRQASVKGASEIENTASS